MVFMGTSVHERRAGQFLEPADRRMERDELVVVADFVVENGPETGQAREKVATAGLVAGHRRLESETRLRQDALAVETGQACGGPRRRAGLLAARPALGAPQS